MYGGSAQHGPYIGVTEMAQPGQRAWMRGRGGGARQAVGRHEGRKERAQSDGKRLSKYGPRGIITTPPKHPYSLFTPTDDDKFLCEPLEAKMTHAVKI